MLIFKDRRKNFGGLILMVTTRAYLLIVVIIKKKLVLRESLMGIIFIINLIER